MPAFSAFEHRKDSDMSEPPGRIRAAFNKPTSTCKSIGRSARISLLIATAAAPLLCGAGAAYSGPCTSQITQLEQQLRQVSSGAINGPTAPQSVEAQLHHQPTPEKVQNGEIKARAAADVALQRAWQADTDGDAAVCTKVLDEAKRLWLIPT
jgi:hypothetical protein